MGPTRRSDAARRCGAGEEIGDRLRSGSAILVVPAAGESGSAGGALQTGRYLDFGEQRHNRLLVSICNLMGLPEVTSFGELDDGSGPLELG